MQIVHETEGRIDPEMADGVVTRWPNIFAEERQVADRRFVAVRNALMEGENHDVCAAFEDYESSIPSWDMAVARSLFTAEELTPPTQRTCARARLDDRDFRTRNARVYKQWLDATELHQALSAERFDSEEHPEINADRRLIYIYGLSSAYITTLAKTASYSQMPALRDAISRHLTGETSIRVLIPVDGFKTFQLEFHVPFPTLRCMHKPFSQGSVIREKTWLDVRFLGMVCDNKGRACQWDLYEANISVVISGWDHCRWVSWTFSNTHSDPTCRKDDDELREDYCATDGNGPNNGKVIEADSPTWDPREYWLRVVNIRMSLICEEWRWLIMNIARHIDAWIREHDITLADRSRSREAREQVFDWLTQTMRLLGRLSERLSTTMHVWARFNAPGGHIDYFTEMRGHNITPMINTLVESFERLADLHTKLKSMQNQIGITQKTLTMSMERENNYLNAESQRYSYETNQLSYKMAEVNQDIHGLSYEMAEINRDIHVLNRTSTNAAVETGRTTRTNVQLFGITTPLILALQYFGAEKEIFSFERNPTSFSIALCILFCVLTALTWLLSILNPIWDEFLERLRLRLRLKRTTTVQAPIVV